MNIFKLSASSLLAAAVVVAAPAAAHAQNCIGMPIGNQKAAVSASIAFPDYATIFGLAGQLRLDGPLSVGAEYSMTSIDHIDTKRHTFGVNGAYAIPVEADIELCGIAAVRHGTMSESDYKDSQLEIPLGVSIGKSFAAGDGHLIPYAQPHLIHTRSSWEDKVWDDKESYSSTDFGLNFGATYRLNQILFNAQLGVTSRTGDSTLFRLGVGYAL